jgi:hypothetical protein
VSTTPARAARLSKKIGMPAALALVALAFPAAAQAHHALVSVSCTGATIAYQSFHGDNTAHYTVTSDNTVIASGTHAVGVQNRTYTVPLTIYGNHAVTVTTTWGLNGGEKGTATKTVNVSCAEAPAPAAAPAPAVAAAPASGVQGVQVSSPAAAPARAVLGTRTSCESRTINARVSGRGMRRVTFVVNGRVVRTVTVRGRRVIRATLPRRGTGVQALTVRVRYANRTQVLTTRARRCAQAQVAPQFTG